MLASHISVVLLVIGVITALPIVQFLFPALGLKLLYKLELRDEAGLFFARHWGLLAACFGGLLVYASSHPQAREPIVLAAMLEKAGLVGTIAADWTKTHTRGMRLAAAFDGACVVVFGAWLLWR
jgi:hypothetical protein